MNLTELGQLKAIGLKRNNLSSVPLVLGGIQSLQEIYLENNPSLEVLLHSAMLVLTNKTGIFNQVQQIL